VSDAKILLVSDGPPLLRRVLQGHGYSVECARVNRSAFARACEFRPDLVVLDAGGLHAEGVRVARTLAWIHWLPILVVSPRGGPPSDMGDVPFAGAVIERPFLMSELLESIERALRSRATIAGATGTVAVPRDGPSTVSSIVRASVD
jgi:DNA-binding response OmpR family regulator